MAQVFVVLNLFLAVVFFLQVRAKAVSLTGGYTKDLDDAGVPAEDKRRSELKLVEWIIALAIPAVYLIFIYFISAVGAVIFTLVGIAVALLHWKNCDSNVDITSIANVASLASFLGLLQVVSQNFSKWNQAGKGLWETINPDIWWIIIPPAIGFLAGVYFNSKAPAQTTAGFLKKHGGFTAFLVVLAIIAILILKKGGVI